MIVYSFFEKKQYVCSIIQRKIENYQARILPDKYVKAADRSTALPLDLQLLQAMHYIYASVFLRM